METLEVFKTAEDLHKDLLAEAKKMAIDKKWTRQIKIFLPSVFIAIMILGLVANYRSPALQLHGWPVFIGVFIFAALICVLLFIIIPDYFRAKPWGGISEREIRENLEQVLASREWEYFEAIADQEQDLKSLESLVKKKNEHLDGLNNNIKLLEALRKTLHI